MLDESSAAGCPRLNAVPAAEKHKPRFDGMGQSQLSWSRFWVTFVVQYNVALASIAALDS